MLILKQEKQSSIEKLTVSLEVSGTVLFKDTPIKNSVIELVVHGLNGETLLNLGKTLSGPTGHFYFRNDIPLSFRGRDIGVAFPGIQRDEPGQKRRRGQAADPGQQFVGSWREPD